MPITSTQAASLINAQNAAFHNQSIQSHQIGMAAANPFAQAGQGLAGATMAAIPAAVGLGQGAAMVAGIAAPTSALAALDPFAMGAARFGAARAAGAGMGAAMGMGAAAAIPLTMGWAAAAYGASQMYQGYSQFRDVRNTVNASFQHINPGSASGRGFDSEQMGQIATTMRNVATNANTGIGEINRTLQAVSSMGMMQTVRDAQDFEKKFTQIMDTVKSVAKVMKVALPEAAGLVGSMRSSGLYTPQDIMGGSVDRGVLQSYGVTGQQVTQAQRYGGQVAHAFGALRGTGARLATRLTGDVARAEELGIISAEQLIEATGMEGPAAYQAMAQKMAGTAFKMTGTSMGRAMMVYAGEQVDGRYTGKIDEGRMRALQMGLVSPGGLGGAARGQIGGRGSKVSFVANEGRLRGAFAEQAGPEMIGMFVQQLVGERFGQMGKDDVTTLLMKRFTDLEQSEAEILTDMAKNYRRIGRKRREDQRSEINRVVTEQERHMHQSWSGTKHKMSKWGRKNFGDPLNEIGQDIGTGIEETATGVGDWWYDRRRVRLDEGHLSNARFAMDLDRTGVSGLLVGEKVDISLLSETARAKHGLSGFWDERKMGTAGDARNFQNAQDFDRRLAYFELSAKDLGLTNDTMEGLGGAAQRSLGLLSESTMNLTHKGAARSMIKKIIRAGPKGAGADMYAAYEEALGAGGMNSLGRLRPMKSDTVGVKTLTDEQIAELEAITRQAFGAGGMKMFGADRAFGTDLTMAELGEAQSDAMHDLNRFWGHDPRSGMKLADMGAIEGDKVARRFLAEKSLLKGGTLAEQREHWKTQGKRMAQYAGAMGKDGWRAGFKGFEDPELQRLKDEGLTREGAQHLGRLYKGLGTKYGGMGPDEDRTDEETEQIIAAIGKVQEFNVGAATQAIVEERQMLGSEMKRKFHKGWGLGGRSDTNERMRDRGAGGTAAANAMKQYIEAMSGGDSRDIMSALDTLESALGGTGVTSGMRADLEKDIMSTGRGGEMAIRAMRIRSGAFEGAKDKESLMGAILSQTGFAAKDLGSDFMGDIDTMLSGGIDAGEAKKIQRRLQLGEMAGAVSGGERVLSGQKHGGTVAMEMELTAAVEKTQERTSRFMTETATALERVQSVTAKQSDLLATLSKDG